MNRSLCPLFAAIISCAAFASLSSAASANVVFGGGSLSVSTSAMVTQGGASKSISGSDSQTVSAPQLIIADGSSDLLSLTRSTGTSSASVTETGIANFLNPSAVSFALSGSTTVATSSLSGSATGVAHAQGSYSFSIDAAYGYELNYSLVGLGFLLRLTGSNGFSDGAFVGGSNAFSGILQPGQYTLSFKDNFGINSLGVPGKLPDDFEPTTIGSENIIGLTLTAISAVPESSTWAMMILGFAWMGLIAFRRKSAALRA